MERMGRVARVEEELERMMVLGLLPGDDFLPSEQVLARQQGVSRATARQALLRLAARGLVVQHPGRRSRAVPLSEAVTLENLSVMLHGEDRAHPERRRLLDGYFALKRDTTVELLAVCCEKASQEELSRLEDACFALQGTAPWEKQRRWIEREFELLRLAAVVANRPGHFLLVRSLERSFWGMAGRLLAHLDGTAVRQWAWSAYHALGDRDVQALRQELPALLQAADDRMIGTLGPPPVEQIQGDADTLGLVRENPPGAVGPNRSACPTGSSQPPPAGTLSPEPEAGASGASGPNRTDSHTGLGETPPTEAPSQEVEAGARGAVGPNRSACHTGSGQDWPTEAPLPECEAGTRDTVKPNRSGCPTGSCQMSPTGIPSPAPEEGTRGTVGPSQSARPTGSDQTPLAETPSHEPETGALGTGWPNRSACPTGSLHAPPTWGFSSEPGSAGAASRSSCMSFGAARSPGCDNAMGAQMWSPVPWPLASPRAGDGTGRIGTLRQASVCLEAQCDDARARQPLLTVTARAGQGSSWAVELHPEEGTQRASWGVGIKLRWG